MWEIVWSDGKLYDLCDEHARPQETARFQARSDGSLQPLDARESPGRTAHRARRRQGSMLQ